RFVMNLIPFSNSIANSGIYLKDNQEFCKMIEQQVRDKMNPDRERVVVEVPKSETDDVSDVNISDNENINEIPENIE
ncbi:MAG: hypothetical protein ACI4EA_02195, partial [Candidatus Ornithomonoglobus sp.]